MRAAGTTRFRAAVMGTFATVLLLGATTACAEETPTTNPTGATAGTIKEGLKITFLPKQVNNPYFTTSDNGGKAAVEEFKGVYSETGPSDTSPSAQVSYINTLSQQGTDVIVVSANDKDAICGALNEARTAGAKVVTFDSDTKPECRDLFINQATATASPRFRSSSSRRPSVRTAARSPSSPRRPTRRTRTRGSR